MIAGFTPIGTGASRTYTFTGTSTAPSARRASRRRTGQARPPAPASFTLVADPTAPTVTVRCNGKPCIASPYAQPVKVTVTASDGTGSGIGTIRYTVDGSDPTAGRGTEYDKELTVRSLTRLKVRAYDKAGNASTTVGVTIASLADKLMVTRAGPRDREGRRPLPGRADVDDAPFARRRRDDRLGREARRTLALHAALRNLDRPAPAAGGAQAAGRYTIVWTLVAGTEKATKTTFVSVR